MSNKNEIMFSRISAIRGNLTSCFNWYSSKKSLTSTMSCCEKKIISIEQKASIDLEIEKYEYESIACTLRESKLAERKNELQKEVFSRAGNIKEIEAGFIFYFPYEEKFLLKMTEYIITEKRCCPFFTFEIKLHQTNSILLEITGPLESKKMLKIFLAEYN